MYKNIVVLTGAGISAESNIPVFRQESGLWEEERVEDVCTPEALIKNPQKVHDFYNKLRRNLLDKKPNLAHLALTKLQEKWPQLTGGSVSIVTQNIDDLHEKASSRDVIHMHGFLKSILCEKCHSAYPFLEDSSIKSVCKYCGEASLRPDIVFFGESPYDMDLIFDLLSNCDLFLAIGTSGVVYPAAGFCQYARSRGAYCVELNLNKSAVVSDFNAGIYGKASQTVPKLCESLLKTGSFEIE